MKVSLTLYSFPMLLFDAFKSDLARYIDANVQVGGNDSVFVNFTTDDIVRAQEAIIICDRYYYAKGGGADVEEESS